jgi:UDP-N-acetylmuramoylalanine--D-glutamate ligase
MPGCAAVTVTDLSTEDQLAETLGQLADYDIEYHLGGHRAEDFGPDGADIIIVNPAVPPENHYLRIAAQAGKLITSQIEIFFQMCPAPIVGITGANGKSTTTAITAHLLTAGRDSADAAYERVWLGGNIGDKPMLSIIANISPDDMVVLELSSFQLEQLGRIKAAPDVSVITNLTPNHLDRHGTFQAYCDAKENIFKYQRCDGARPCVSIFNAEDTVASRWFEKYSGQPGRECLMFAPEDVPAGVLENFALAGRANRSNLAAALQVTHHFGVTAAAAGRAIKTFKALAHRLELVAKINDVSWYNDSIATTPPSAIAALEAFDEPKIIIVGGYDKNLPFDEFGARIASSARAALLIGSTASKIAESIESAGGSDNGVIVEILPSLEEAVERAARIARAGDVVLLSPACASYDMFDNFRHRAKVFVDCLGVLKANGLKQDSTDQTDQTGRTDRTNQNGQTS